MKVAFTRVSRVNELICIENDRDDGSRRAIRKQLSAEREETSPGFSTGLIGSLLPSPLPNRYYHFYNKIDAFSSYDETRSVSINHIFFDHSPMLHRIKKFSFILLSSSLLACLRTDARNYTAGLKQRSGKTTEILGHFDKRRPSFSFRPTFFRRFWSREFVENESFFLVVAKIGESVEGTIKDSKETEGRMLVFSTIREPRIRKKYSWRTNR